MTSSEARSIRNCFNRFQSNRYIVCKESCPAFGVCKSRIFSASQLVRSANNVVGKIPELEKKNLVDNT